MREKAGEDESLRESDERDAEFSNGNVKISDSPIATGKSSFVVFLRVSAIADAYSDSTTR